MLHLNEVDKDVLSEFVFINGLYWAEDQKYLSNKQIDNNLLE